jgi:tetratricopeptide (TPR) repeat protein
MAATRTPHLTRRERDVLVALCKPAVGSGDTFVEPASIRAMADRLGVSDAAIKQHLLNLYDKFELFEGEDNRRVRLANLVFSMGLFASDGFANRTEAREPSTTRAPKALIEARDAIALRNWQRAFELLVAIDKDHGLGPTDLEALGEAAIWTGSHEESIAARERAYALHLKSGNTRRAGAVAIALVANNVIRLQLAPAAGWFTKAKRHLEAEADCVEKGALAFGESIFALATGNAEDGLRWAGQAFDAGERFGDADLRALGLAFQGFALVQLGRVGEATPFFDEAMASAVQGELGPMATGHVYCRTICACLEALDYRRALEWTEAIDKVANDSCTAGFHGDCRMHRASISIFRGEWVDGEREARLAGEESERFDLGHTGLAFYEVGLVRLRMGDFDGAEDAFRRTMERGVSPQPGLALLQLARGDATGAASSIKAAVAEAPVGSLRRARMLTAQVEIADALSDGHTAGAAAVELGRIAGQIRTPALQALAAGASGIAAMMHGDPGSAAALLREACRFWRDAEAPYELARARTHLASALSELGDSPAARLEIESARATFERLGALPDLLAANGKGRGRAK